VRLVRHGVKYLSLACLQNIECQIVEMSTANEKLTIVNVYVAPQQRSSTENDIGRAVETLIMQRNFVVLNTGHPTFHNNCGH